MQIQRQSRIRPPRHRWSHEVWEATVSASEIDSCQAEAASKAQIETTEAEQNAESLRPVILKTCQWGDARSPFTHLRRLFIRRESSALAWMAKHAPDIAPKQFYCDENQIVMERFTGPDFFNEQKSLTDNRQVWERLNKTVNRMHEGGLAHGELRLGNLIFHNDEVRLVDFATAFTKGSSLYKPLVWMDKMAIVWMKAHIFRLPLDSEELSLQDNHKILNQWFLKYIACDIPYA